MGEASIFCAKCGAAGQRVNSYCRSCGEWLPDPVAPSHLPARLRRLSPERKQRRIQTLQLLSALAAAAAGLIALAVSFGLHRDVAVTSFLLCLLVVAWQCVAILIGRSLHDGRAAEPAESAPPPPPGRAATPPALAAADTEDLLRPPSVTESTTALLERTPARKGWEE